MAGVPPIATAAVVGLTAATMCKRGALGALLGAGAYAAIRKLWQALVDLADMPRRLINEAILKALAGLKAIADGLNLGGLLGKAIGYVESQMIGLNQFLAKTQLAGKLIIAFIALMLILRLLK